MTEPSQTSRPAQRLGFWLYGLHLWTVFGLALSNALLGLATLLALWLGRGQRIAWRDHRRVLMPLALYTLCTLAAVLLSSDLPASARAASSLAGLLTLPVALVLVRGERAVRRIIDLLILATTLFALYGLAQLFVGFGDLSQRIRGPFSHYMTFAGVLLIADFLLLAQLFTGDKRKSPLHWAALVVINVALMASLTRSAWVGFAITFTVLLLLRAPRWILAYVPATVLFVWLAPAPVLERVKSIADLKDVSNYDRLCMVDAGLHMVRERPLFGVGPGMVRQLYPLYRHPTAPQANVPHLHNTFLEIGVEQGLLALAAYLWLMIGTLGLALRRYRSGGGGANSAADIYLGVFLALLAFNLAGVFEDNWSDTEVFRLALFLIAAPYCLQRGETEAVEPAQ